MNIQLKPEDARLLFKSALVLGLFAVVAALLVIPSRNRMAELDGKIAQVQSAIAEQEAFAPVYANLIQARSQESTGGFGFPARQPMPRAQLQELPGMVQEKAVAAGLEVLEMTLDANSVLTDRSRVLIQGVFSGRLAQFRLFFAELQSLPSLNRVEKVEIRAVPDGLEYFVQMRFALS